MTLPRPARRVVLLDRTATVESYAARDGAQRVAAGEDLLIALTPAVQAACRRRALPAQSTLPYFSTASHRDLLEASDRMVAWIDERAAFADETLGVRHAYQEACAFWARLLIYACLRIIEIASRAVEQHRPEVLVSSSPQGIETASLSLQLEEGYVGRLVEAVARKAPVSFESLPVPAARWERLSTRCSRTARTLASFMVNSALFERDARRAASRHGLSPRPVVVMTTPLYQMDRLTQRLQAECPERLFRLLPGPVLASSGACRRLLGLNGHGRAGRRAVQQRYEALAGAVRDAREVFSYRGIAFSDLVARKISGQLAPHLASLHAWAHALDRWLERAKPSAVLSNGIRTDDILLAELCRRRGIPSVLASHGSHVRPTNAAERIEWGAHGRSLLSGPYSHLALQSPMAEGYLEAFPSRGTRVKTGPLIWGTPVDRTASRACRQRLLANGRAAEPTRVVVHAGTPKMISSPRFYVYETPDEYVQSLRELAEAVLGLPQTVLVIKFRPSPDVGVDDLKLLVPFSDNVLLSVEEPFRDVLGMADLLVSFSSTTIEEALQNGVPVLLYGGGGRYQHVPARAIRAGEPAGPAAAYHVQEASQLRSAVEQILALKRSGHIAEALFDPYRYPAAERTPLAEVLRQW